MGLLKVQQHALRQLSCPLEIMQYMKRAARVTYDKDQLFKVNTLVNLLRNSWKLGSILSRKGAWELLVRRCLLRVKLCFFSKQKVETSLLCERLLLEL